MNATPHPPQIPDTRRDDLHHLEWLETSQLNLFMAGNQFMVMEDLLAAFREQHPHIQRIYYQTLPPGLQLKQILAGGARFRGRTIAQAADIYTSVNEAAMQRLVSEDRIDPDGYRLYLHNRLTILVPSGNPAGIASVADLGGDQVRVSQPDPANEDIAHHIIDMYRDAGGDALVQRIMEVKRADATTILTVVHHRETPLRLEKRTVDAGPVWSTEADHALHRKLPVEVIEPGPDLDQRHRINYYVCQLKQSPNPANAQAFRAFMSSDQAH